MQDNLALDRDDKIDKVKLDDVLEKLEVVKKEVYSIGTVKQFGHLYEDLFLYNRLWLLKIGWTTIYTIRKELKGYLLEMKDTAEAKFWRGENDVFPYDQTE